MTVLIIILALVAACLFFAARITHNISAPKVQAERTQRLEDRLEQRRWRRGSGRHRVFKNEAYPGNPTTIEDDPAIEEPVSSPPPQPAAQANPSADVLPRNADDLKEYNHIRDRIKAYRQRIRQRRSPNLQKKSIEQQQMVEQTQKQIDDDLLDDGFSLFDTYPYLKKHIK